MTVVYWILTRGIMALVTLMSADALLDTTLAAESTSVLATFCLLTVLEVIIEANTQ